MRKPGAALPDPAECRTQQRVLNLLSIGGGGLGRPHEGTGAGNRHADHGPEQTGPPPHNPHARRIKFFLAHQLERIVDACRPLAVRNMLENKAKRLRQFPGVRLLRD